MTSKASIVDKCHVLVRAAQVGTHVLADRIAPRQAIFVSAVPASVEQITPEWLTAVLCKGIPGAKVIGVSIGARSSGTSSRAALKLDLNAEARAAGLPPQMFTKSTPTFAQRMLLGLSGGLVGETGFYMQIRPQLDIEAPRGYHACVDPASWRSMILMDDIVATRGAKFISTETYIDRATIEDLLGSMAKWHGYFWDSPQLRGELSWLRRPRDFLAQITKFVGMKQRSQLAIDRYGHLVPADIRDRTDELWEALAASVEINRAMPQTFLHGDCHIGQTYLTRAGRIGYSDWQMVLQGGWAYDVNYAVVSALTIEDRRNWERELIRHYLERLHAAGGPRLDFDAAWLAYRQHALYPYFCWAYTRAGAGTMQPDFQPDYVCNDIMTRTAHAVSDLEAAKAVNHH